MLNSPCAESTRWFISDGLRRTSMLRMTLVQFSSNEACEQPNQKRQWTRSFRQSGRIVS